MKISTCGAYNKSVAPFYGSEISGRHEILAQNCQWCESSGYTKICYPKDAESSRYYHGIVASLPNQPPYQEYGRFSECDKRDNKTYTEIHDSYLFHINSKCDICACKCLNYEKNLKWLYSINLTPQVADIANNMIVTGIRFRHRSAEHTGHVIYPEIKVGKLLPNGEVTDGKWKIVEGPDYTYQYMNFDHHDQYVGFGERPEQARYVNLDDAYAEPGRVVTGVRFVLFEDHYRMKRPWYITLNDTGRSVGLAIKMTPFNFTTGKLNPDPVQTFYSQPDNTIDVPEIAPNVYRFPARQEIYLEDLDVPTKSKNSKPVSQDRNYVRFTMSDKFKDFGQTTVPFIDIQPVETSPPSPLSGIGLFLKKESGYGGFLAFKLMTLNMSDVIKTDIPEEEKINLGL
ncbi:hypothetical protein PV325_002122 [Microctonus aethiopoides]|nr:hypothetical protein PV325_002122 [Microctonus aethiopoides]